MMNFIESNGARIAAWIQAIGVGFDPEVLSLPGGSFIAAFLWLQTSALMTLKRCAARKHPAGKSDAAPASASCFGRH